ncbi:MAG: bifunctional oligoribonuclease/PAP phosphatase NrnA [Candidatus Spechtbacterales bacterium]
MKFLKEFDEVSLLIRQKNNILLAVHEHPDGDALGSMIAMFSVLRLYEDKRVIMFSRDPVPEHLNFLPYIEDIVHDIPPDGFKPDLFLGFDYGSFERLGISKDLIKGAAVITFDHHPFLHQIGDILIIDDSASSTCEIVYRFLSHIGFPISMLTATSLLAGIFTDTGGFTHVNTSVDTLNIVGDLLRHGASIPKLHKHTFSHKSPDTLRVWGAILRNISHDEKIGMAYIAISNNDFINMGSSLDAFAGIVNIISMPPNVHFSLLLIEHAPGVIKGSLRSEPFKKVDVSQIAFALGGGGHKYAAGFELKNESLKEALERVKIAAAELA